MQQEQQITIATERLMLLVLAAIHFTAIVDFLIIMPLGPQYMRVFDITSAQFGLMVSAYGISAGLAGILLGIFLGRMDRKNVLLGVYAGFSLGTFFCALAPNYPLLLASRAVTGGFGGVLGALIFAIVADVIPEERRGSAMGLVMSSVAAGFVFGVPIGVFLAAHLGWQMPFFALAGLSFSICGVAARLMPSARVPLAAQSLEPKGSSKGVPAHDPDYRKRLFGFSISGRLHDRKRRGEGNRLPANLFVRWVLHHFQRGLDRPLGRSRWETVRFQHCVLAGDYVCSRVDQPPPCAGGGCPCDYHIFHDLHLWTGCSSDGAGYRQY